ncbi:MAG: hypothetical protein AB9891_06025 [Anaerolineaceae bacterium]
MSSSIINNRGRLGADMTTNYNPTKPVLKLNIGYEIKIVNAGFRSLLYTTRLALPAGVM